MKRAYTLKKVAIQSLIKKGQVTRSKFVICYWQKNSLGKVQVGVGVSKKIKTSWQKNLIKRQLRAIISQQINWLMSVSLILIAKENYPQTSFSGVEAAIKNICQEITSKI